MKIDGTNYSFIDEKGLVGGEAMLFMKSQPLGPDGTIGVMIEPGTFEWLAWETYFAQTDHDEFGVLVDRFPKQRQMLATHSAQRKHYMVPAQLPWVFDATFSQDSLRPKAKPRMSKDMTPAQVQDMLDRITKKGRDPERLRNQARQNWELAMVRLAPTPEAGAAFVNILAARPDLCDKATNAEQGKYGMGWGAIAAEVTGLYWNSRNRMDAAE